MQADINLIVYKNFIILDLELSILLDKSKLLILLLSLINILIYNDFDSNSDYIDNNLVLDVDFVIRQELEKLAILLRTRTQCYNILNKIIKIVFNKRKQSNKIKNTLITLLLML